MTPDRWRKIEEIYHAAERLETSRRDAYIADACHGDEGLRRAVDSLLAATGNDDRNLERPAWEGGPFWREGVGSPLRGNATRRR